MSRLPRAVCLLAASAVLAGCGAHISAALTAAGAPATGSPASGDPVQRQLSRIPGLARSPERPAQLPAGPLPAGPIAGATASGPASIPAPADASSAALPGTGSNPVVALGDSLTFGWGRGASPVPFGPAPVHSYPWYLGRDLDLPVVNAGISGTTSHEVLDPSSEPNHPRPAALQLPALLALHPRLMIVSFGSNEVQRGWPMWQASADLNRVLARISNAGIPIVLVGTHIDCFVSPCPQPGPGFARQRYLSNWDGALAQMAARYQAGLVLDVERGFTSDDLTDWIHPTALGYWRMAQRIEPEVVAVLQRQAQRSPGAHPAPRLPDHTDWSPPPQGAPDDGQREPRSQSEIWPGGPHEDQPWTLDRLLSFFAYLGATPSTDLVTQLSPEDEIA